MNCEKECEKDYETHKNYDFAVEFYEELVYNKYSRD